jgi:predicted Co/Zn/Cd cation transporter (cation efflux family)
MTVNEKHEKTGIIISIVGGFLLASSAVIMALIARSQAILFDGLYSLITLGMAVAALKVINLVASPETKNRPFGYMALEPFFNLVKSIIMLILLVFFLVTNIQELLTGGRDIALDLTTIYIFICLAIYGAIILLLMKCRQGTESNILAFEIKNWCVDALITAGIAVSLVAAMIAVRLGYTRVLPYVDPVVVILLTLVSFPVPIKTLVVELRRLLLISTENSIEQEVKTQLAGVIEQRGLTHLRVWGLKSGRTQYLFIYCGLKDEQTTVEQLDKIRGDIFRALSPLYSRFWADILFTEVNPEGTFPGL